MIIQENDRSGYAQAASTHVWPNIRSVLSKFRQRRALGTRHKCLWLREYESVELVPFKLSPIVLLNTGQTGSKSGLQRLQACFTMESA